MLFVFIHSRSDGHIRIGGVVMDHMLSVDMFESLGGNLVIVNCVHTISVNEPFAARCESISKRAEQQERDHELVMVESKIGNNITVYRCRQAMTFTGRRRCPVNRPIFPPFD